MWDPKTSKHDKNRLKGTENKQVVGRDGGMGETGKEDEEVQTCGYKISHRV